ncbi:MAG: TetR/AcrR family transcriptional regulator [Pseudomonadota bacterium]
MNTAMVQINLLWRSVNRQGTRGMPVKPAPSTSDIDALGRQAAKSKATQDAILRAVIGLINEEGFAAASSTRIAKRAGVTWGAVQHHFGSKEDILEEVLQLSHSKFHETLSAKRFTTGSADGRVSKYIDAAWQHYQGEEYMATLEILLATRGHGKDYHDLSISSSRAQHLALGRRIFHDSKASDKKLGEAIYIVHCMLTGILVEMALEPDSFGAGVFIKHTKRVVSELLY